MTDVRAGITRRVALPLTAVLITAAALLWHRLPVPTQIYAPFDVHGSLGSPVRGRTLDVTVTKVRVAPKAKFALGQRSSSTVSAIGTWLVVDATVSALTSSEFVSADLMLGGNTYQQALRAPARGFGVRVDPGLPQHGYWVFDVAPELIQPTITGPLQVRVGADSDGRLNDRLVIDLANRPLESSQIMAIKPFEIGPAT
ncbi:MAG TPA: hypothetical protein VN741_10930 [Mycobacterium sp.]|nr:hypothetical protein [Mycobacterium sp.]